MPKLPAVSRTVSNDLPRYGPGAAAELGREMQRAGGILSVIAEQQDESDIIDLSIKRRAKSIEAMNNAALSPDLERHETIYLKIMSDFNRDVLRSGINNRVQKVYQRHDEERLALDLASVRDVSRKLKVGKQIAGLDRDIDQSASIIAQSVDEKQNAETIQNVMGLIDRMEENRFLDPVVAEGKRQYFSNLIDRETKAFQAMQERERKRLLEEAREQENIDLYRSFKAGTLTPARVLGSKFLSRDDMNFFITGLEKKDEPKTDPSLAVTIENLIDGPTSSREQQIQNAVTARAMIENGFIKDNTLAKGDALNMMRRANKILEGKDPDSDRWFSLANQFLKDKFQFDSNVQRFFNPDGAARYWKIRSQIMEEQEINPLFTGKAVFDRAVQLAEPEAVDYLTKEAAKPQGTDQLPDPARFPNKTIHDKATRKKYRSDGSKWVEVR